MHGGYLLMRLKQPAGKIQTRGFDEKDERLWHGDRRISTSFSSSLFLPMDT